MTDQEHITPIEVSDTELALLNEIVRKYQVTLPSEDLVLLLMGKKTSPLPPLVIKIATAFESRQAELQKPIQPAQELPTLEKL